MAQGCSVSWFLVFINDFLKKVEKAGLGVEVKELEECCVQMIL